MIPFHLLLSVFQIHSFNLLKGLFSKATPTVIKLHEVSPRLTNNANILTYCPMPLLCGAPTHTQKKDAHTWTTLWWIQSSLKSRINSHLTLCKDRSRGMNWCWFCEEHWERPQQMSVVSVLRRHRLCVLCKLMFCLGFDHSLPPSLSYRKTDLNLDGFICL